MLFVYYFLKLQVKDSLKFLEECKLLGFYIKKKNYIGSISVKMI